MGKKILHVTTSRSEATNMKNRLNATMKARGIRREAYVTSVSQRYVQSLLRPGFKAEKRKNYAIAMRNK